MPPLNTDSGMDMNKILVEILNTDSPFGQEMRSRISSTLDVLSTSIQRGAKNIRFSNDPINIASIYSISPEEHEAAKKQFTNEQDKIYKAVKEVAMASNWKDLKTRGKNGYDIIDLFGEDKAERKKTKDKFKELKQKILKSVEGNIPSKMDNISKLSDINAKNKISLQDTSTNNPELNNKQAMLLPPILDKLNNLSSTSDSTNMEDNFIADAPQSVIIAEFSEASQKQLSSILGALSLTPDLGNIKIDAGSGGGLFSKLFGGILKGLGIPSGMMGMLSAAGPFMAIAGGLLWMGVDALRGMFASEKWGVSKTAGALGGVLGGMDSGLKGAMKNMGKWALIGAGIGSFIPVVGTIIGGLVGAAIGAILGWIGGERISKAIQATSDWFMEKWNFLIDWVSNSMLLIFDSITAIGNWFSEKYTQITEWVSKFLDGDASTKWDMLKAAIAAPFKWIGEIAAKVTTWVDTTLTNLFGDKWTAFKDSVAGIFNSISDIGAKIILWADTELTKIFGDKWESFKTNISNVFTNIGNFGATLWTGLKEFFTGSWDNAVATLKSGFTSMFEWVGGLGTTIKDMYGKLKDAFIEKLKNIPWVGDMIAKANEKEKSDKAEADRLKGQSQGSLDDKDKLEKALNRPLSDREREAIARVKTDTKSDEDYAIYKALRKQITSAGEESSDVANDFISRPGQPIQKFSGSDVLIGTKEKIVVENKNLDKQMFDLTSIMKDISSKIENLISINIQMAKRPIPQNISEPLPAIASNISTDRPLAQDEALRHKTRVWELLHGVA